MSKGTLQYFTNEKLRQDAVPSAHLVEELQEPVTRQMFMEAAERLWLALDAARVKAVARPDGASSIEGTYARWVVDGVEWSRPYTIEEVKQGWWALPGSMTVGEKADWINRNVRRPT